MKILLANTTAYPTIGGVENSLRYIGRELRKLGHEVKIFCLKTTPGDPARIEHEGVEILRATFEPPRWPHRRLRQTVEATSAAIPAILQAFPADAIWSRSVPVGVGIRRGGYAGPLLQIFSTNARMNCHGIHLATRGLAWKRRLMLLGLWPLEYFPAARLERELAHDCIAVAFSENMRNQLQADFPPDARSCHVIPPGVDGEAFSPANGERFFATLTRDYGIQPGEPLVLYVGRLSSAKHLPTLMEGFARLATPGKLVLVGDGPDRDSLYAFGRQLGLGDRMIFAGVHHEMLPGFYAMSRVSVLPTTTESFGQVYLESLACGTPTVGFAGDGKRVLTATSEIIRHRETGFVAQRPSAEGLAEGMASILALGEEEYRRMSDKARADALERYSWRRFVLAALELSHSRAPEANVV